MHELRSVDYCMVISNPELLMIFNNNKVGTLPLLFAIILVPFRYWSAVVTSCCLTWKARADKITALWKPKLMIVNMFTFKTPI